MKNHIHFIGPKKPGRPCPDVLRCILCGVSTNRKKHVSCELSDKPGGRLCGDCADKAGDCPHSCVEWVERLLPQMLCQICTSRGDELIPCSVCERDVCTACLEQLTFHFWAETGKIGAIICADCFPTEARFAWQVEDFCVHCMDFHKPSSDWPCRSDDEFTPLVESLRNKVFPADKFISLNVSISKSSPNPTSAPNSPTIISVDSNSSPSSSASVVGLPSTQTSHNLLSGEVVSPQSGPKILLNSTTIDNRSSMAANNLTSFSNCGQGSTVFDSKSSTTAFTPSPVSILGQNRISNASELSSSQPLVGNPTYLAASSLHKPNSGPAEASLHPSLKDIEELFSSSLCGAISGLSQGQLANNAKISDLDRKLDRILALSSKKVGFEETPEDPNTKATQTDPVSLKEAVQRELALAPVTIPAISEIFEKSFSKISIELSNISKSFNRSYNAFNKSVVPASLSNVSEHQPLPNSPRSKNQKGKQKRWYGNNNQAKSGNGDSSNTS